MEMNDEEVWVRFMAARLAMGGGGYNATYLMMLSGAPLYLVL